MSVEQQLARARATLRAGDRVRARQLLGSLLRQDPTLVEGWLLLSKAMSTRAASQWCLQCAARFVQVDDENLRSKSAHPDNAASDPAPSDEFETARSQTDDQPAPSGPRLHADAERPGQTSHRLAEAWEALDADGLGKDSELASVSRALKTRREETTRRRWAGQRRAAAPRTERREMEDRPAATPAPGLRNSSAAWRAVYLEPARAFLEEEEKEKPGASRAEEEAGGALTRLSRMAVRATRAFLGRLKRVEQRSRTVAQLLLFGLGILLLCNGASLLYPRVIPSLRRDPWLAEAAPALEAQREEKTLASMEDPAASAPTIGSGRTLQREGDPSTAQAASLPSASVGQSVSPSPLHPSLATSDLPETRTKPNLVIRKAVPSRLVIPALGLDAPVVPITSTIREIQGRQVRSWDVPGDGAAGWHTESSPLGVVGNTVLNGHNTTGGEVFRDLYRLQPGDEVIVFAGHEQHVYTVDTTAIFREAGVPLARRMEQAQRLAATDDQRLTLVTCHPYGSTVNRLVVTCLPQRDRTAIGRLKE